MGSKPQMGFFPRTHFVSLFLSIALFSHQPNAHFHHYNNGGNSSEANKIGSRSCNLYRGKWVFDSSYPLYDYSTCPFIDPKFNCQKFGRPDKLYQNYRWQPFSCDLPRFNGLGLLEKWRGKKIMFVGDSLGLNMWESLSCMIHAWVPNAKTTLIRTAAFSSLTFEEYGVKLLLHHTPYLVDLVKEKSGRVLKLDSIRQSKAWRGMDYLIFNTGHWWTHTESYQPWDYMEEGGKMYKDMNRLVAFYKGLTTWARWVNRYVDPSKTKVFFQGISPVHYMGSDWGQATKSCKGETEPYFGWKYPGGTPQESVVVNKVLARLKKPVYLLDTTALSQDRKDAHPTAYSGGHRGGWDCSHWCLPGLPDTWNQLLYAALIT